MITKIGKSAASLMGVAALALTMAGQAQAITFTGSSGSLSASADFTIVGGNLQVVLTNTSTADVLVPANVLTGVFFSVSGPSNFSSVSALLTGGSTVIYDPDGQPAGGVVGGEWAYATGLSGAPNGATSGISSSGLGLFGVANFPGANLAGPSSSVDGLQYGIVSAGDNAATGNGGITGTGGLIRNSVTFTLGNIGANFNLAGITNVSFQYGTALTEPNIPSRGVPEPSTLLLLGAGLAGMGIWRRKFAKV